MSKSFFSWIQAEDPYVADLLRIADEKIAELTKELNVAREEKDGAQMKIDSFRQQVLINHYCAVSFFPAKNVFKMLREIEGIFGESGKS